MLGLVLAAVAPGGSYLMALPALAGSVAGVVAGTVRSKAVALVAVTVGAAVAVLVLVPTVLLFFPALGLATAAVPAALAVLLGMALLPVLEVLLPGADADAGAGDRRRRSSWAASATAVVATVALVVTGLVVDRFDADSPAPSQLMYALDADTGQARWVSEEADPGGWTARYVERREDLGESFPILGSDPVDTGPAPAADLPAPALTTVADTVVGGQRRLTVRLRPQRAVRLVVLDVSAGAAVVGARADGRDVPARALGRRRLTLTFHAPPPQGVELGLTVAGTGPVTLRVMDGSDGLAELPGFAPRPAAVGVAGSHLSELAVVARTVRLP